jgi:competence protein ComEA
MEWLERYRWVLLLLLVVVVLFAVVLFQVLRPQPEPIQLSTATPPPSPGATSTPRPLRVYVSGAVRQPDVYLLEPDSIVKDALTAAGGATDDADLDRINLASPVVDGQQVYVPRVGEEDPPVRLPANLPEVGGAVNINTAGVAALESLPGIGPVLAQRIVDYRQEHGPFTRIEEIMDVPGIGQAKFEDLRDLITTE